jgi:COP9 signalosome complex subunit 7
MHDAARPPQLASGSSASSFNLLKLFAYGTWRDYTGARALAPRALRAVAAPSPRAPTPAASKAQLPALTAAQQTKLKKLSVVTLASQSKSLAYDVLMRELEARAAPTHTRRPARRQPTLPRAVQVSSVREVENLLIECIYDGLLQGKLNQLAKQLEVHCCIGRDLDPSEVSEMCATLSKWHENSSELLGCLGDKLTSYKQQCDAARGEQAELEKRIEAGKAGVERDGAERAGGSTDFEMGIYEEDDKMRKGGRAKGKHAFGIASRK